MRPVLQTRTDDDGNCTEAALASVLELEVAEVIDLAPHRSGAWFVVLNDWLAETHGLHLVRAVIGRPGAVWIPDVYHLMAGPGPRGRRHCVVGCGGVMVHDPHPSGAGLVEVTDHYYLTPARPELARRFPEPRSRP